MKRLLMLGIAGTLLVSCVACSREEARDTAADVYDEAKEGAREAANRAEDVINDRTVTIKDVAFHPQSRTVKIGTEVTWVNSDAVTHTVTANKGAFDSDNLEGTKEFSFRFTQSGEYPYHCEIHGKDRMSGTIIVE
jgi:plastocyanin